jgi:hypothetical protein
MPSSGVASHRPKEVAATMRSADVTFRPRNRRRSRYRAIERADFQRVGSTEISSQVGAISSHSGIAASDTLSSRMARQGDFVMRRRHQDRSGGG